jgi:hypothetical protein
MPVEIAIGGLVAAAVKLVAEGLAKKSGEETASAGFRLLAWMHDKLTGRAKEALEEVEKSPASDNNQADLRKQLTKLLETQPQLLEELKALVPADQQVAAQQTMKQIGSNNKGAQVAGQENKVRIS